MEKIVKLVFISLCGFLFLYLVAYEATVKFFQRGVVVEVSTKHEARDDLPAVTLCASSAHGTAYKTALPIMQACINETDEKGIEECIRNYTFSFDETLKHGTLGVRGDVDIKNRTFWNSTVHNLMYGLCHTLFFPHPVGADMVNDALYFALDTNLSYRIFLHDPKYYYLVRNPLVSPRIFQNYKDLRELAGSWELLYISTTEHHKLNRETEPCETDPQYNFFACIKASLAREVGCRPFWDKLSPPDIPPCTTMEQMARHQEKDQDIWMRHEQKIILNMTGCKVPCTYKEFKTVGDIDTGFGIRWARSPEQQKNFWFMFNFVSTDIRVETEAYVYPLMSFVSEFGGGLGLFLGFSFLTLWDGFEYLLSEMGKMKKHF